MPFPLFAAASIGSLLYVAHRRRLDPTWDPLAFLRGGADPNTGANGGFDAQWLNVVPDTATHAPVMGATPSAGMTGTSQLGVKPATPTPFQNPGTHGAALWRPGFTFPEVRQPDVFGGDVRDSGAQRADLPARGWDALAQSLGIAASVVNPGIFGAMSAFGAMTGLTTNLSLGGVITSIAGVRSDDDYAPLSVEVDDDAGDLVQLSGPGEDDDAPPASPQISVEIANLDAAAGAGADEGGGGDDAGDGGGGYDGGGQGGDF